MAAGLRTAAGAATLGLLALLGAQQARSAEDTPVLWRCWYESSGVYRIRCVPRALAGALAGVEDWENLVDIPIYVPPYSGTERSERLARAALCGRNPACRVGFDPERSRVREPRGN